MESLKHFMIKLHETPAMQEEAVSLYYEMLMAGAGDSPLNRNAMAGSINNTHVLRRTKTL